VDTAILISSYNRKDFLKNTLESLFNTIPDDVFVSVMDDASTDDTVKYLSSIKRKNFDYVHSPENFGLRAMVNVGLMRILEMFPRIKYICYTENDVLFRKGWLEACKKVWESDVKNIGFVTCHSSPEHPCKEEKKPAFPLKIAGMDCIAKPTERSTHLFASAERWKKFLPILPDPMKGPKPSGIGSKIDWWMMGHPVKDKYEESKNSIRNLGEKIIVVPGGVYHMGNIGSTWFNINGEEDAFVNLILPYRDRRDDICFQFNPHQGEIVDVDGFKFNREFWNLPKKKIGAFYATCNEQFYVMQSLLSIQKLVDYIVIIDNGSKDKTLKLIDIFKKLKDSPPVEILHEPAEDIDVLGYNSNRLDLLTDRALQKLKGKVDWAIQMEPDLVFYELPDDLLRKTATYLELRGFNCLNPIMRDFVYDYAHINSVDYGEGPGDFYSERRIFKLTPSTEMIHRYHHAPCNVKDIVARTKQYRNVPYLYRFWPEWEGLVAKTRSIAIAHYGFCRGIERVRMRTYQEQEKPFVFWDDKGFKQPEKPVSRIVGTIDVTTQRPRMVYNGKHPKFMGLD